MVQILGRECGPDLCKEDTHSNGPDSWEGVRPRLAQVGHTQQLSRFLDAFLGGQKLPPRFMSR
eukprot:1149522-Pelagomonas_calceolata.AAC.1